MTNSWWCGLTWQQFTERAPIEAQRMIMDRKAVIYRHAPSEQGEPRRPKARADTAYHLEADAVDGVSGPALIEDRS